jgi:hypothetical protein
MFRKAIPFLWCQTIREWLDASPRCIVFSDESRFCEGPHSMWVRFRLVIGMIAMHGEIPERGGGLGSNRSKFQIGPQLCVQEASIPRSTSASCAIRG